jgi:Nitroreductase
VAVNDEALDIIFRSARTYRAWRAKPVSPALLMALYDVLRWGPTALNANPLRIVFVTSPQAKERLLPHLEPGNVAKVMGAPVTAILGYDTAFPATLAKLNPHSPHMGDAMTDIAANTETAYRSGTLQGAYFIIAARALGLDCGPMSGFSNGGVDAEFFAGTGVKSNFLCNIGYGDPTKLHPRAPRLSFDETCTIV